MNMNIAKAILKAQKEMGNAVKDSKNPFFKSKYADLNSIREASIPVLNAAGISVLQPTVTVDGRTFVRTTLLHESGETITSDTEIICAKQNDPQAQGSAISYARRYGLQSLLCIGAVDDDAELSMGRTSTTKTVTVNSPSKEETVVVVSANKVEQTQSAESSVLKTPAIKPFVRKATVPNGKSNNDGI